MRLPLCSALVVATIAAAMAVLADGQKVPYDPERAAYMRAHFAQAMAVHEAVIRGDLQAVASAAKTLADAAAPDSMPKASAGQFTALREAARSAADAKDIAAAANATALMLSACGDCHRGVGTMPAIPLASPSPAGRGGVVGRMREHQQAADQMLHGLVIPSTSRWQAGAKAFADAPLTSRDLAMSEQARRDLSAAEERLHRIAAGALDATESRSRATFYSQILAGCADCHKRYGAGPKPK